MRNRKLLYAALFCFVLAGLFLVLLIDVNAQVDNPTETPPDWVDVYLIVEKWTLFDSRYVYGYMYKYPGFTKVMRVTEAVYNLDMWTYPICKFWDFEGDQIFDAAFCYRAYRQFLPLGLSK